MGATGFGASGVDRGGAADPRGVMNVPESGRVAAICDADLRRTVAATEKHKTDWRIYQDYRELIEQQLIIARSRHMHLA